jgi:hypothetical protein
MLLAVFGATEVVPFQTRLVFGATEVVPFETRFVFGTTEVVPLQTRFGLDKPRRPEAALVIQGERELHNAPPRQVRTVGANV